MINQGLIGKPSLSRASFTILFDDEEALPGDPVRSIRHDLTAAQFGHRRGALMLLEGVNESAEIEEEAAAAESTSADQTFASQYFRSPLIGAHHRARRFGLMFYEITDIEHEVDIAELADALSEEAAGVIRPVQQEEEASADTSENSVAGKSAQRTEATTAGDSTSIQVARFAEQIEAANAGDTNTSLGLHAPASRTEVALAQDFSFTDGTTPALIVEGITASDTKSATLETEADGLEESSASEVQAATFVSVVTRQESTAAADSTSGAVHRPTSTLEPASANEASAAGKLTDSSAFEQVTADDQFSAALLAEREVEESASASEVSNSSGALLIVGITEAAEAGEVSASARIVSVFAVEVANASELVNRATAATADVIETADPIVVSGAINDTTADAFEITEDTDDHVNGLNAQNFITEEAEASDSSYWINFSTARILKDKGENRILKVGKP